MFDTTQDVLRLLREGPPRIGERNMMAAAIQQLDADELFQLADLLAQRGLRGAKARCSPREVQFLCDSNKIAEVSQFHVISSIRP
jgi:hypothetical protein